MKKDTFFSRLRCSIKYNYCKYIPLVVLLIMAVIMLSSCSSIDRKDDAVRIKRNIDNKYNVRKDSKGNQHYRNGTTLNGTVLKVLQETTPNSCPVMDTTTYKSRYFVIFLDSLAESMDEIEKIPIEDVELIGQSDALSSKINNKYNNINWFENFNNPLDPRSIREVPVDSIYFSNCPGEMDCNCNPLSIALQCPDCKYKGYFVEIRGCYAVYDDRGANNQVISRENYYAEIAFGYRWDNFGLGLMLSSGIPIYNLQTGEDFLRPLVMIHGRMQMEKFWCMFPYIYGQLGFAVDYHSLKFLSNDNTIDGIPAPGGLCPSVGLGIGLDIPLPGCPFDLSADFGYKLLRVGQEYDTGLWGKFISSRIVDMFALRIGITLGY